MNDFECIIQTSEIQRYDGKNNTVVEVVGELTKLIKFWTKLVLKLDLVPDSEGNVVWF
jgi:hypothetical protein